MKYYMERVKYDKKIIKTIKILSFEQQNIQMIYEKIFFNLMIDILKR